MLATMLFKGALSVLESVAAIAAEVVFTTVFGKLKDGVREAPAGACTHQARSDCLRVVRAPERFSRLPPFNFSNVLSRAE
jgi:hypothetical protein